MSSGKSRREFLRDSALSGLALWMADQSRALAAPKSPNDRIAFACIGLSGKGDSDTADAARFGDVVAICDVDDNFIAAALKKYPNAKPFNDYRKMFDEMGKSIDACTVSTPDHHHVHASTIAMRMGKHVYCQKPLTHSIWEARRMGEIARETKVATQMGNQGTASNDMRRNAYAIRGGALGQVKEIHVWTNRPIWPQGIARPAEAAVPSNLHWDLWLGPAPKRPYGNGYHTFNWRGFWDFGTGALGDMACHTVNMPYMALDLKNPISAVAETAENNKDSYPAWSIITYEFPANANRGPVKLVWYDGGKKPPKEMLTGGKFDDLVGDHDLPGSGCLIIGDKGRHYTPGDSGDQGHFVDLDAVPEVTFPVCPGHWEEFVGAIRGGKPAMSNFPDYAGPLVEAVLVGNLAAWVAGTKIDWDPKAMRVKNTRELDHMIRPRYSAGYKI